MSAPTPALEAVHPVLGCRDVEASARFYEALGFTRVFLDDPAAPRYAVVRRDAVELHLQWHDASELARDGDRPVYRFLVSDVDALHAELLGRSPAARAAGAGSPWRSPGDTPWGTREFHLRDPDGNGLQFYRPRGDFSREI